MNKTFQIQKRFSNRQNGKKRLSCEELETLKERFVDFIDSNEDLPPPPDTRQLSRLSVSSESAESSMSSSSSITNKPEPPMRTVSIKNLDDTISIKSIYSSCRGSFTNQANAVRSSRSVFSIYEEEDESSSIITSSSSSSSSYSRKNKLDRLNDFDIEKIESFYRSIGSIVNVSQCTCDLLTTNSDDITSSLNDCWKLEHKNIVPVLIFDTGYNPKRPKQMRLTFVDKKTSLPIIKQSIQIDRFNSIKYPNIKEKCLTFKLNEKICLLKFYDFFSCTEFFRFFSDVLKRNPELIVEPGLVCATRSMISLNKNYDNLKRRSEVFSSTNTVKKQDKRNSHYITITKHCISSPCAFQHVNSLKNDDQHVKNLIDSFNLSNKNNKNNLSNVQIKNFRK